MFCGPLSTRLTPTPSRSRPALFLDRDGVLNERDPSGYVTRPDELVPLDLAVDAGRVAQAEGRAIVIITNQGCIGRGLASVEQVAEVNDLVIAYLADHGIGVDAVYVCPHHPAASDPADRTCGCRKPLPGMLLAAAADLSIDLAASHLVGDSDSDMKAAAAAGIPEAQRWLVPPPPPMDLAVR